MVKVKLILLDEDLRRAINKKEVVLELLESEATVEGLLRRAVEEYGAKILEAVSKVGTSILLNGQSIEFLGGAKARLSEGDRVAIMPLIVGGFKKERIYTSFAPHR